MLSREIFEHRYRQLVYITREKGSEPSFTSGLWFDEEGYKYDFWEKAQAELQLEKLKREIDNKFEVLHAITKQEEAKKGPSKETSISPQERETIRALKREGWTINEIASRFKRTPTEIDLLLSLPE